MTPLTQSTAEDQLTLHIAALTAEIDECISHIACSDLLAMEESLWSQELLATTLVSMLDLRDGLLETAPAGLVLRSMAHTLLSANKTYSELVQQVGQENSRLLQLACQYGSHAQMDKAHQLQHLAEA